MISGIGHQYKSTSGFRQSIRHFIWSGRTGDTHYLFLASGWGECFRHHQRNGDRVI